MEEEMSLSFVLDGSCVCKSVIEKVCNLASEYFRAIILADKAVMLGLEEESRQVLDLQLHAVVCNKGSTDDYRSECDVV